MKALLDTTENFITHMSKHQLYAQFISNLEATPAVDDKHHPN
jgi:hypothetical protein